MSEEQDPIKQMIMLQAKLGMTQYSMFPAQSEEQPQINFLQIVDLDKQMDHIIMFKVQDIGRKCLHSNQNNSDMYSKCVNHKILLLQNSFENTSKQALKTLDLFNSCRQIKNQEKCFEEMQLSVEKIMDQFTKQIQDI